MKEMLKKACRSGLSLLLAACLMLGMCSNGLVALAVEWNELGNNDPISYVALGASNTNGFGLMGYLPDELYGNPVNKFNGTVYGYQMEPEKAYPSLVANALKDLTGKEVELEQLAISSMRAEELHVLLDNDYYGDKYTEWRFTAGENWFNMAHEDGLDGLRAEYQAYVANADVITVDIGANNFGVYASNRIFNNMFDADFTRFDEGTQRDIAAVKAEIEKILNEYATDLLSPELSGMLDHIVDTMTYALVGFCVNFDASMKRIYELNPDATVVVVNIQNLMHGLYATLPGMDEPFAFGEFYGAIVNMANTYVATVSPYADKYYCAYIGEDGQAETFLKDIQDYTGNPEDLRTAVTDCFDVYDNSMYVKTRVLQVLLRQYKDVVTVTPDCAYTVDQILADSDAGLAMFSTAVYENQIMIGGAVTIKEFLTYGAAKQLPAELQTAYDLYEAALLTVYDTAATFMQLGANSTVMDLAAAAANFETQGKAILQTMFAMLEASIVNPGLKIEETPEFQAMANDPTAMAIITLGVRSDLGNSFFSHPNENGHVQIKDAIINALENEISGKEIVLEKAIALIAEYYDEAYAYGYAYALENGYIDIATGAIDDAIAELQAIDLTGTQMTEAFKAELEAEINEIIETLEKAKALLEEADVLDQASLDALLATLTEAGEAAEQLLDALVQAGYDVNDLVIVPAVNDAIDYIENVVIPAAKAAAECIAKAAYDFLMEKLAEAGSALKEAYENLTDAAVEAAKKYAPELAEALYNYLLNNPEEVIAFFAEYGPYMMELVNEYGDEALAVVGYVLYNYGDEILAYVCENNEQILNTMCYLLEEYGDEAWELICVYAEALGLCDLVREQIAELEKELAELEQELNDKIAAIEKELSDLYAQLENAADELKAEIQAKIDALEAELAELKANVEAKIAEVKAAIAELKAALKDAIESGLTKLENLKDAIENLDEKVAELIDAAKQAALDEIRNAIEGVEDALEQLDQAIADLAGEVYEDLKEQTKELLNELIEQIVKAAKKYAPALDKALYDYLYNHPYEVIAFFTEYGDCIEAALKEYGDEVLSLIGMALYLYGEDLAKFIIENPETVLAGMIAWGEKYGERVIAIMQVYAEALGLCDAVRDQIAELEEYIEKLEAEANAQIAELEAKLEELKAELEKAVGEAKAELEAQIAELEAKIAEIKAAVEEKIAEAKEAIEELKEQLEDLIDAINECIQDVEASVEEVIAEIKEAIEELKETVENVKETVEKLIEDLREALCDLIDETKEEILNQLEELLNQQIESLEEAIAALEEALAGIIAELKVYLDQLIYDATHADITIDKDFKFVALGDATAIANGYAEALKDLLNAGAAEHGVPEINFINAAKVGNTVAAEIENLTADVVDADLITLGFSQTDILVNAFNAAVNGEEFDWAGLTHEKAVPYIAEALAKAYAEIDALGLDAETAAALKTLVEAYAYGATEYALSLPVLIQAIREVNADGEIIVVGMHNALAEMVIDVKNPLTGESLLYMDLSEYGKYFDYIVDAVYCYGIGLATLMEGVTYVDARDVQIEKTVLGLTEIDALTSGDMSVLYPSVEGDAYIAEQIYNALNITYVPGGLLGDADSDGDVDNIDAMLILQYYTGVITEDQLDLTVCDVDGNGVINNVDAMLVLQYYTQVITVFPAE